MAFRWRWLMIFSVLLLGGGPGWAAGTREDRAYAAALGAFQDGMWSRAETEFARFAQKYPKSERAPEAILLQAQAEFNQGKLSAAIALLVAGQADAGSLADRYVYWIGEAQFQNNDFIGAAATLDSLVRDFPKSSLRLRAVVEAAAARERLNQWPQIIEALAATNGVFQQALQMDPGSELAARGRLLLARARLAQNDFAAAAAVLAALNGQSLKPELDWDRAYLLYRVKLAVGDTNAALAAATNLVQIARLENDDALRAEGVALRAGLLEPLGQTAEAMAAWQEILTLNAPSGAQRQAVLKLAQLAITQNQLAAAEQSLEHFRAQFPDSPAADVALLTLGELYLKDFAAQPAATNQLSAALARLDQFKATFTNSPLLGKAYLDRGWCLWLAGKTNAADTLAAFQAAAQGRLPPEDQAEARFKMGDVRFAQADYAAALKNYRAVLEDYPNSPAVMRKLGGPALYQSLRASLALTNYAGASAALEQILRQYPTNDLAASGALLYAQSLAEAATNHLQAAVAREQFQKFLREFPASTNAPQAAFAAALTYEQETNWSAAIAAYRDWLKEFPSNELLPQVNYKLAWANFQAGKEAGAFRLFTNFVAEFPSDDLAPLAQYWVADYYFRQGGTNYVEAERNYKLLYQNTNWQNSPLIYPARLMAGRAAMGRQDYKGAIDHFTMLWSDTNCSSPDLNAQALFGCGSALMAMDSPDTNNPLANFQPAIDYFSRICQLYPTNEISAAAWNEIGDCEMQLTNYDAATNAYAQVFNSAFARVSARSRAEVGCGVALEKKAALASGDEQRGLLAQALNHYADVLYGENLRDDETADPFWSKKAGLQAANLAESLGQWESAADVYRRLKTWLPQLSVSLDKKIAEANAHLPEKKDQDVR